MKKQANTRVVLLVMAGSLLLLLTFIFVWLHRVYQDEYERFRRDADFVFINAIRSLESDMMSSAHEQNPVSLFNLTKLDSSFDTRMDDLPKQLFGKDTSRQVIIFSKLTGKDGNSLTIQKEDNSNVKMFNRKTEEGYTGMLSVFIQMNDQKDSMTVNVRDAAFINELIGERLSEKLNEEQIQLPSKLEIIVLSNDLEKDSSAATFFTKPYTDLLTNQSYALEIDDYRPFVLRKMWQEISFATILFLSIAFSFWFIYRTMVRQARLTALKHNLVRNITHELKTPITTVGVAIEALGSFDAQSDPQKSKEYLDISRHELDRLSVLVDKVLTTAFFEDNSINAGLESIDLDEIISRVIDTMKTRFEKVNAKLEYEKSGTDFIIEGNRLHLTNVVYNLLENALKYSENTPEIRIQLQQNKGVIMLKICDRGIGIPTPYLSKVFEPFFRVPTGDHHNVKGHGLGLAYVANVITKHKGTIKAENRKGGGVCFTITLSHAY